MKRSMLTPLTLNQVTKAAALSLLLTGANAAFAVPADLDLVLTIDVSGSIDTTEYNLQMDGYEAAFEQASVQNAIANSANGVNVNVVFYAESATAWNTGWQHLTTVAEVQTFADALGTYARPGGIGSSTDIADGISMADSLLDALVEDAARQIIDVSGDGVDNTGPSVTGARDAAVASGYVINGLPILNEVATLDTYYQNNVIGGAGAFVEAAADFDDFERAVSKKIQLEVVPEPATLALMGLGLVGIGYQRRRKVFS